MRPVQTLLGYLLWRVHLARTGYVLRLRSILSSLVVFGGIGAAVGYAVVGRLLGTPEVDDEADIRPEAE